MNRKNWFKRIGSLLLALCLTLGLVAEWVPMIGQASNAYTELTMESFGFSFGEYTGENQATKTPITSFDGVAITDTFKFETDGNVDGIATDVRIGAADYWQAPVTLMVASGALYSWNNAGNANLSVKLADVAAGTSVKVRMEFNVDGTDMKVNYYVNDMENIAVTQTYPASTFSPKVFVYGAQGKKVTVGAKKEYKEYTFADYGITAGEYTGQTDNTTTPSETTLDGVAITETLKLSADRNAYIRFAGVTASGWESPIDLYHADGVLYCYDQTPSGDPKHDFQLHTSLAAGTEFKLRMEFDYVGTDVKVNFYINNMDTPLNTHTYEGYASKFTHKILMYTQNGAKITVGKKKEYKEYTFADYGITAGDYSAQKDNTTTPAEATLDGIAVTETLKLSAERSAYIRFAGVASDGWEAPIDLYHADGKLYCYDQVAGGDAKHDFVLVDNLAAGTEFKLRMEFDYVNTDVVVKFYVNNMSAPINVHTYEGYASKFAHKIIVYASGGAKVTVGTPSGGGDTPATYTELTLKDFGFDEGVYTGDNEGTKIANFTNFDGIAIQDDVTLGDTSSKICLGSTSTNIWEAPITLYIESNGNLYARDFANTASGNWFPIGAVTAGTKFTLRMEFDYSGTDVTVKFYINNLNTPATTWTYAGYADKISSWMLLTDSGSKNGSVTVGEPYIDPFTVHSFADFGFPAGEYTGDTLGDKVATLETLWEHAIVDELILEEEEGSKVRIGSNAYDKGYIVLYIKNGKLYVNDESGDSRARGPKNKELASVAAGTKFKIRIEFKMGVNVRQTVVNFYVNDLKTVAYSHAYTAQKATILPQVCINGGSEGKKVTVGTPGAGGGGNEGGGDEPIGPETYTVTSFAEFGLPEGHYTGENRGTTPEGMTNFSNVAIVDTVTFEEEVATRIGIGAEVDNAWLSPITLYLDQGQLYTRDYMNTESGHWFPIKAMMAKKAFKLRIEFDYAGDDVTVKFYVDKMGSPAITREYKGYANKIKPTVFVYGAENKYVSIGNPDPIPAWPTTFNELTLEDFGYAEDAYTGENYGVQPEGVTSLDGVAIEDTVTLEASAGLSSIRIGNPSGWEGYLSLYIDKNPNDNNNEWLYVRNYVETLNSDYYFPLAKMAAGEKFKFRFEFSVWDTKVRVRYYINDMDTKITERTYTQYKDAEENVHTYKDLFVPKIMIYGGQAKYILIRDAQIPQVVYTEKTFADFGIEDGLYVSESKGTDKTLPKEKSMNQIFLQGTITLGGYVGEADVRIGAEDYWNSPIQLYISNDPLTGQDRLWAWDAYAAVNNLEGGRGLSLCPMKPGQKFKIGMKFLYKGDDVFVTYYIDDMENALASYKYVGYAKDDIFKPNMMVFNTNGSVTVIGDRTVDTAWPTEFTELTFKDFGFPEGVYTGANHGKQLSYKSMDGIAIEEKIAFEDNEAKADIRFGHPDGWQGYISLYLQDGMIWVRDYYEAELGKTMNNWFSLCAMNPEEKFTLRMEFDALDKHMRVRFYVDGEPIVEHIYNDYADTIKPTMMLYGGAAKHVMVGDAVVEKIDYKELTFEDFGIKDGEYTTRVAGTPKDKKIKNLHGIAITETITFSSPSANVRIGAKDEEGWLAPLDIMVSEDKDGWFLYSWNELDRTLNSARLAEIKPYEQFKLRVEFKYSGKTVIAIIYVNDMENPVTAMTFQNYADKIAPRVMVYGSDGNALLVGKGKLSKPKPIVQATPEELGYEKISLPQFGIKGGTFKKQAGTDYSHTYGSFQEGNSVSGKYLDVNVAFQGKNMNAGETSIRYASADGWRGISIGVEGGSLRVFNASVGGGYTFSLEQLGLKSFDKTFNIKLGVKTGKKYNVGTPKEAQDLTFCLWVNDKLIAKDAKLSQVEAAGDGLGIFVSKNVLQVNAPKGMRGVDFTLFGFTNKWEKELGIK